jgi:exopolyphosphatase/guanosine-5'-triphosphate,3'-diphosphate pyrophosphatase
MTLEQLNILRKLARDKKFGRGAGHANHVNKLALRIYEGLVKTGLINGSEGDKMILEAAALLHDIGLPNEPHNEAAFDFLAGVMPELLVTNPLPDDELSTLLYCILWHRGSVFAKRGSVAIADPGYTRKMAAIIRVGDAFDRTLRELVEDVSIRLDGARLTFGVFSKHSVDTEIQRAKEKSDLMKQAYGLAGVGFEYAKS